TPKPASTLSCSAPATCSTTSARSFISLTSGRGRRNKLLKNLCLCAAEDRTDERHHQPDQKSGSFPTHKCRTAPHVHPQLRPRLPVRSSRARTHRRRVQPL